MISSIVSKSSTFRHASSTTLQDIPSHVCPPQILKFWLPIQSDHEQLKQLVKMLWKQTLI